MTAHRTRDRRHRPAWVRAYTWRLALTDTIVVLAATTGATGVWFVVAADRDLAADPLAEGIVPLAIAASFAIGWLLCLQLFGTRDARFVGSGLQEYSRTADATTRFAGLFAIVALLAYLDPARILLVIACPLGLVLILVGRWCWRQWLREQRYRGRHTVRVLVVGSAGSAGDLAAQFAQHAYAGFEVVGLCMTAPGESDLLRGHSGDVPVYASLDHLEQAVEETGAFAVALAGSHGLAPSTVRAISWRLDPIGADLMVAPSLTDVAGTRIHTRPVAGLPLIYVESPRYEGGARILKRSFDVVAALGLVVILVPVLLAIAVVVRVTSPGPALYTQERVGRGGRLFRILKFRTMRQGADAELAALLDERRQGAEPLFKIRDDPRVTRVGRFLRSTSLDELPQLFNVLRGDMSLVGPRPQVPAEVALYSDDAARRLLVRPGITGLWQISGRSELSWDDAVRLDLYYVENWSLTDDLIILLRTARAVALRIGAH